MERGHRGRPGGVLAVRKDESDHRAERGGRWPGMRIAMRMRTVSVMGPQIINYTLPLFITNTDDLQLVSTITRQESNWIYDLT